MLCAEGANASSRGWSKVATRLLLVVALVPVARFLAAQPALVPPTEQVLAEARALVERMTSAERGPYSRLRWFCRDGSVLPPEPYACRDHGGGRQHAEYSAERQRLAALGWPVGTIVAALTWDELWSGERHQRLRQLPLERYLVDVDEGWILRRARHYRGRVQAEDEEEAGRELLLELLAKRDVVRDEPLLVRESVRTLPHHGGADRTRNIRRLAQEIAERDGSFERIRIKIHTAPAASDAEQVRGWLAGRPELDAELAAAAQTLLREIDSAYGERSWLSAARSALAGHPGFPALVALLEDEAELSAGERVERRSAALAMVRDVVAASQDPRASLAFLDLSFGVESELMAAASARLAEDDLTRANLLALARSLVEATYGVGLLSPGERRSLAVPLAALSDRREVSSTEYAAAISQLRRATQWISATVRFSFAEALVGYGALEPESRRFVDDLLRGSPALSLAETATRLARDADLQTGLTHRVLGRTFAGLLGLNPGMAVGRLRVVTTDELARHVAFSRDEIVVLPRTVSELEPVAGILTRTEGNLLSHIQLLARNLGIPNASISLRAATELARHSGKQVLFVVGPQGSVLLEEIDDLANGVLSVIEEARRTGPRAADRLEAPIPDLTTRHPIALADLHAGLAGRVVGPKAANLGELARHFPGRVAPAVALPFGLFAESVGGGEQAPRARLLRAYAAYRASELDEAGLEREIASVREAIRGLRLQSPARDELRELLRGVFGPEGSYGAFIRSDTNVEDLPGFTGAGLNETVPNVVGFENQLAAIGRVWSSAFSPRAVAWRSALLEHPEEVYSSVLVMKSVAAEKSGVLVTTDLATRGEGLTVATAWGVGGAVDGDAAETIVLRPDGSTSLVGEAKAPYRRRLAAAGGIEWVAASAGEVLTAADREVLRGLVGEIGAELAPARDTDGRSLPWDIEFGFVDGKLALFQIRPLVERGQRTAERILSMLAVEGNQTGGRTLLDEPPLGAGDEEG